MKICFRHMMTMIWMCNLRQLVFGFILLTASCMLYIYSMANYSGEFETSTRSVVVLERMFHHRKRDLQERKRKFTQSLDQNTTGIPELVSQTFPQAISTSTSDTSIHNVADKLKFNSENWKKK
uniref:Uncharacterized protein n=1 Tax=Ciona savignyi TaxID=51511 RepID=H2YU22_CIOSA